MQFHNTAQADSTTTIHTYIPTYMRYNYYTTQILTNYFFMVFLLKVMMRYVIQKWLKPGGRLLISDYCCLDGTWSDEFTEYVNQRGYILLSVSQYGKVNTVILDELSVWTKLFGIINFLNYLKINA